MNQKKVNTDRLIQGIRSITKNRYSLSDEDQRLLEEVIQLLEELNLEERLPERQELIIQLIDSLLKVFLMSDDIESLINNVL